MARFTKLPQTNPQMASYLCTTFNLATIQLNFDSRMSSRQPFGQISLEINERGQKNVLNITIAALNDSNANGITALNLFINNLEQVNENKAAEEMRTLIKNFWQQQTVKVAQHNNAKAPYYSHAGHVAELIHPDIFISEKTFTSLISVVPLAKAKATPLTLTDDIINKNTALFTAILDCDLPILQSIFANKTLADFDETVKLNIISSVFKSKKSQQEKTPVLKLLIEKGGIYLQYFLNTNTTLENLRALLLAEANVNVNNHGNTGLHIFLPHGMFDHVKLLLDYNIDINSLDNQNGYGTALHICIANENVAFTVKFIKMVSAANDPKKIDYSARDKEGKTPLIIAAKIMSLPIVNEIITQDKQCINLADNQGRTALHFACVLGNINIVTALVKAGASLTARDKNNKTPLDYTLFSLPVISGILSSISIDPNRDINALSNAIYDASGAPFILPLPVFGQSNLKKNTYPAKQTNSQIYGEVLVCQQNKDFIMSGLSKLKQDDADFIRKQIENMKGTSIAQACLEGQQEVRICLDQHTSCASNATIINAGASSSSSGSSSATANANHKNPEKQLKHK